MLTLLNQFFQLPEFKNPNQERVAQLLNISMWLVFVTALALPFIIISADPNINLGTEFFAVFGPTLILIVATFVIRSLLFSYRLQAAGVLLSFVFMVAVSIAIYNSGLGIQSPSVSGYAVVIILAGSLSEGRFTVLAFTVLSLLLTFGFYLAQIMGYLPPAPPFILGITLTVYAFVFILTGALLSAALRRLTLALERAQSSEQSLLELTQVLEHRVADRTRALESGAEVSRRLSIILDQEQLMADVVDEVQRTFDYYHALVYLLDERRQNLVLAGGTGEVGEILLANGHKLPVTKGLVGQAVREKRTILVPDVTQNQEWVANGLLGDTVAEIVVPIMLGDEVKGVLDVQHNVLNQLSENDRTWLELIAGQVAVVLENARLFRDAELKGERESLVNEIGQKIQQANSVEDVLKIAARELGHALNSQRTRVQIGRIEL